MLKVIDISDNTTFPNNHDGLSQFDGVYIKATEGGTYISKSLERDVEECRLRKIPFGFYHFAGHVHSAQVEYNFFKSVISKYKDATLKDCLDYEDSKRDFNFITEFMKIDSNLIFYSYRDIANNSSVSKAKTWIAIPEHNQNALDGYLGIQYLLDVNVPHILNVDVSIFSDSVLKSKVSKPIDTNNIIGSVTVKPMLLGEKSLRVKLLQNILNAVLNINLETNLQIYGQQTKNAVARYQKIMGLPDDGDAGKNTVTMLLDDMKKNWFKV